MATMDNLANTITQILLDFEPQLGLAPEWGGRKLGGMGTGMGMGGRARRPSTGRTFGQMALQQMWRKGPFGGYVEPEEVEDLGVEWEEAEAPMSRRQRRRLAQQQQPQQQQPQQQVPIKAKEEQKETQKEAVPQAAEDTAEKAEAPRSGLRRVPIDIISLYDKYCIEAELPGFKKDDVKVNLRPGGILTICACVSEQLKKGVEPQKQPQQLHVPVQEQQQAGQKEKAAETTGRPAEAEPQQVEQQQGRQPVTAPAEKEMLEEKVPEPSQQQRQQQEQQAQQQPSAQPTYAQRVAHEQQGQQGAELQGQQAQLQYVRQERVIAPAHRVIKLPNDADARGELIQASFKDGLLSIEVPKIPKEKLETGINIA